MKLNWMHFNPQSLRLMNRTWSKRNKNVISFAFIFDNIYHKDQYTWHVIHFDVACWWQLNKKWTEMILSIPIVIETLAIDFKILVFFSYFVKYFIHLKIVVSHVLQLFQNNEIHMPKEINTPSNLNWGVFLKCFFLSSVVMQNDSESEFH